MDVENVAVMVLVNVHHLILVYTVSDVLVQMVALRPAVQICSVLSVLLMSLNCMP